MNIKKRNAKQLHHPFHFTYLNTVPIILIIAGLIWVFSLQKARNDLRRIGRYIRGVTNPNERTSVIYHKVRSFDTIESLAEEYGVSEESILWANEDLPYFEVSENMIILIPPVTGVIHTVQNRETIESIAKKYGVNPDDIRYYPYNNFSTDPAFPISPGQTLMVPGGKK